MLGRDPAHAAALPTKKMDCGHDFLLPSKAGQIDHKCASKVTFQPKPGAAVQSGEFRTLYAVRAVGLELCT